MKKLSKPAAPKRRSPVPPPGRVMDDIAYDRRKDKCKLRTAVRSFREEPNDLSVELVVFDLDGTLWTVDDGCSSLLSPPLRKTDNCTVIDSAGNQLHLVRDARKALRWLRSRGILISVAARSDKKIAFEVLKLLRLLDWLVSPQVIRERKLFLLQAIRNDVYLKLGRELVPDRVLLVDDSESNVFDAESMGFKTALIGRDIESIGELPRYLSNLD